MANQQPLLSINSAFSAENAHFVTVRDQSKEIIEENRLAHRMEFRTVDTAIQLLKAAGFYG